MSEKLYGRNRDSVADIELDLHNVFLEHPDVAVDDTTGQPSLPATALPYIFREFAAIQNGRELMEPYEMEQLKVILETHPDIEVSPEMLLGFIANRTRDNSSASPPPGSPPMQEGELEGRGRKGGRSGSGSDSRSSSSDSVGTSRNHSRPSSRAGSHGGVPQTPKSGSFFDASRRQRSTPLANAPSSWAAKRPPHHRRKSDAGSRSDSEQMSASPSAYGGRPAGRIRAPSNPTSPSMSMMDDLPSSPPGRFSRPSSRQQGRRRDNLDDDLHSHNDQFDYTLRQGLNSLPMPHANDSDSDSDDEARMQDMIMDRSAASSAASMMPQDRVEALQRVNDDLQKKLMDMERTTQRKLAEQEAEQEDLQMKLDEVVSELSAAKREEKELRLKERSTQSQIQALELDVARLTRQLEASKNSYANLQKQYQDQLSETSKYRAELREREDSMRNAREEKELTGMELRKLKLEGESYEARIAQLEQELAVATQAHVQLDEQKQENLLLKETIDRMRFDLDEMRSNNASVLAGGGSSGHSSAANTISKSLGAELMGRMKWMEDAQEDDDAEEKSPEPPEAAHNNEEEEDTEGEDVIQTIITRKKRKVQSRAATIQNLQRREFEERKEYSDTGTQYDLELFYISSKAQTDPEPKILTASGSTQTDPEPEPVVVEVTPPRPDTAEMEIQTEPEPEEPKAAVDAPPAYKKELSQEEQEEHDWRVTVATLKKYHPGARLEEGVPGGVSLDALEDWRALQEELGVSCLVVDKILENSPRTDLPRAPSDSDSSRKRRSGGRFYNIYNTYVYGGADKPPHPHSNANPFPAIPSAFFWIGVTSIAFLAVGPSLFVPYYAVPGGPTMHDRAVWNSFNTMKYNGEGFGNEADALWGLLGKVTGGAARMVRGWPQ
ncbi:hypothetical protein HMN09_01329500 [Mycena chlorophos]|uniref:Uncharacterized protein n=1 Tax=Mycena chlorophos TaxID=658473 RepID=A0A8H6RYI1_MYCCL|nr:hypothetical protein HMN09_01329500 [Mycena chlorophos]